MNVLEAIRRKRAVRQFQQKPLPAEVVQQILYAGRRAQSSKNQQAWHFIAIQDPDRLKQLATYGDFTSWVPNAAMCVLIVTPDPESNYAIMFDAGQAAAYMQIAGVELGVGSCMVTFHRPDGSREFLGIPSDLFIRFGVGFGYPADPAAFEPAQKQGGRKGTGDVIHYERFGQHSTGAAPDK